MHAADRRHQKLIDLIFFHKAIDTMMQGMPDQFRVGAQRNRQEGGRAPARPEDLCGVSAVHWRQIIVHDDYIWLEHERLFQGIIELRRFSHHIHIGCALEIKTDDLAQGLEVVGNQDANFPGLCHRGILAEFNGYDTMLLHPFLQAGSLIS